MHQMYKGILHNESYGVKSMLKTVNPMVYKAFGLTVLSEIILPELPKLDEDLINTVDIVIELGDLSKLRNKNPSLSYEFNVTVNQVVFEISSVASFSIEKGEKIVVSPYSENTWDLIRLYLLGTCMGVLLMQRKIYPLHGSAVAVDGKAYAFVGDSGAGKSTLASAFLNKGYQLVSDDVIAVSLCKKEGIPIITPSYPQQKLWQESLHRFGMDADRYRSVYGRETKYCIPVNSQYFKESLPLAGVFELSKTNAEEIHCDRIRGLERLSTLYTHTYRNFLIFQLGLNEWHFNLSTKIANQVNMYTIKRPTQVFTANQLVDLIINMSEVEV